MAEVYGPVEQARFVWVFVGQGARLPSAVFSTKEHALAWAARARVEGVMTRYPLDESVFDWAISSGVFQPKRAEQSTPTFVQRFTSAHLEHFHVPVEASVG